MNDPVRVHDSFRKAIWWLHILLLAAMIFNIRALASISLGSLAVLLIGGAYLYRHSFFLSPALRRIWLAAFLFFLLQVLVVLFLFPASDAGRYILLKTSIVTAPLIALANTFFSKRDYRNLFDGFCLLLAAAVLYCLVQQMIRYLSTHDPGLFFYHTLVSPLHHHAVQFSVLVLVAFLYLLFERKEMPVVLRIAGIIFLGLSLLLLSSRLINAVFVVALLVFGFRQIRIKKYTGIVTVSFLLMVLTALFVTRNPFSIRFREVLQGEGAVWNKERFEKSDYLNGARFRLLQWKLVPAILREQNAWYTGTGMVCSQQWLNKKYTELNLYTGVSGTGDNGYLGYNTHNQFLESLLQNGWPGLLCFTVLSLLLLLQTIRLRNSFSFFVTVTLLLFACTESVLETQYGMLLFLFLPLLVIKYRQPDEKTEGQGNL